MPEGGIFGGVFMRGGPVADDAAWLRAMLAAEAGAGPRAGAGRAGAAGRGRGGDRGGRPAGDLTSPS